MLNVVSDLTSVNPKELWINTCSDNKLKPYFTADFDADSDFAWYEELGRLITRTNIIGEVKSENAWQFFRESGDSDFCKRLEKGLSQARLIIVDPTVVQSPMLDLVAPATEFQHQYTTYEVLWQMLAKHSPLNDLITKEVMLPDGVGVVTDHIGRFDSISQVFNPDNIIQKVGRSKNLPSKHRINEAKVLRFISQMTSAFIDVVNPEIWHGESEQSETIFRAEKFYRDSKINIRNLSKSCDRGKWFDDDTPKELHEMAEAVLHDVNTVNRVFNPRAGVSNNHIGGFDDYEIVAKAGHWRYASDIAAGFARKWYEDHVSPDPVVKAKWLASQFRFVIYNGSILSAS